MIKLYSFDVFDTLLTRAVATPYGIFALLSSRLGKISNEVSGSFYDVRINAEALARKITEKQEVAIGDIYRIIQNHFGLSDRETQSIIALERNLEVELSVPIQKNIAEVRSLISAGEKVVLISDFYWGRDLVEKLLYPHFSETEFSLLNVYISSEIALTKRSGDLFRYVAKNENVNLSEMLHTGDDRDSDIRVAQSLGIKTRRVLDTALASKGRTALVENLSVSQLLVGCGKLHRLENQKDKFAALVGLIVGPLFYSYLKWVFADARVQEIDKLFFVSRDGQIFCELAHAYPELFQTDIPFDYIYFSRRSVDLCLRNPSQKNTLIKYLKQLGFYSCKRVGLVDIGWTGGMHDVFYSLAKSEENTPYLVGYYLGMYGIGSSQGFKKKGFIYDIGQPAVNEDYLRGNANFFECLTSADHGTVYCYKDSGEKIVPVTKNWDKETLNWDFFSYRKSVFCFFEKLKRYSLCLPQDYSPKMLRRCAQRTVALISCLDFGIIDAVASYRINCSTKDEHFVPLVRRIRLVDLIYLTPKRIKRFCAWPNAMRKVTNPVVFLLWRVKRKVCDVLGCK